jgi:hypothetical protein
MFLLASPGAERGIDVVLACFLAPLSIGEVIAGRLTKYRNHRSCLFLPNNIRDGSSLKGSKAIVSRIFAMGRSSGNRWRCLSDVLQCFLLVLNQNRLASLLSYLVLYFVIKFL